MDAAGIREIFAGILNVRIRRMFGGHGIFDDELMFALEVGGEIFLKADDETRAHFEAAGSAPFTFSRGGKPYAMSYWRMPLEAFDDTELLRIWVGRARDAARRAAYASVRPRGS